MRILLTSDWQLGAGSDLGQGDHGPGSRFQDQVDSIDRIADLAVAEKVGLVAHLGDVFERARPAPHEILAVQAFVRRLLAAGIPSIFLMGNHDSRGNALPSALEIFQGDGCEVALQPSLYPHGDVTLAVLPWCPPGAIVAAMPDVARDDVNDAAGQALAGGAQIMLERARIEYPDAKPILLGHWALSGAALPTGLDTAMLREPVIPLEAISESGYALAAFGHIHLSQVLAASPTPTFFCGTPMVQNWGEADSPHGVWIYDSAGDGALKFHPIADNRRFVTLDWQPYDDFAGADVEGAVVRVKYTVSEEEARRVDQPAARAALLAIGATKVIFRPTIVRDTRARVAEIADDLDATAALELWIAEQGVNGSLAELMRVAHAGLVARLTA